MTRGSRRALDLGGGLLVVAALGLFVSVLGMGTYRLTAAQFDALVGESNHREAFRAAMSPTFGRTFQSPVPFVRAIADAITDVNAQTDDWQRQINPSYQGKDYALALTHASFAGAPRGHAATLLAVLGALVLLGAACFVATGLAEPAGIKNNGVQRASLTARGALGMVLGVFLLLFYVGLYRYPEYVVAWLWLVSPVSEALLSAPADRWFFYGFLYTVCVAVMGARMLVKYRHSRYHLVRTGSVIFFQTGFAFLIPAVLAALNQPSMDLKNAWPLDYGFFYQYRTEGLWGSGLLGKAFLLWGIGLSFLVIPAFAALFGKRWYCSWVCGCGGLAETLGDPFRHLSNKSLLAWRIERWSVHGVLVLAVVTTGVTLGNSLSGGAWFGDSTWRVQEAYGFYIGFAFAGLVGTGFYPLMGNRVWCRFGCPLAAILGMVQRTRSRFRITTNGGQCISCGNCSTYCEMGIDVRSYAQRGENIVRASCVGCGVCAAVCPRGVLALEQGPAKERWVHHGRSLPLL